MTMPSNQERENQLLSFVGKHEGCTPAEARNALGWFDRNPQRSRYVYTLRQAGYLEKGPRGCPYRTTDAGKALLATFAKHLSLPPTPGDSNAR